ncbi:glycosyltransferase family 2 protein [Cupriavidus basilensis]
MYPDIGSIAELSCEFFGMSDKNINSADEGLDIAVVIPCFKVKKFILSVIERVDGLVSAIYVVDDACPEGSGDYVKEHCKDPRVTVVKHEKNKGVGGAVMTGYRAAIADGARVIVKIDGDGQMDPALLPEFVMPILGGEADYTKGNRSLRSLQYQSYAGNAPVWQRRIVVPGKGIDRILEYFRSNQRLYRDSCRCGGEAAIRQDQ